MSHGPCKVWFNYGKSSLNLHRPFCRIHCLSDILITIKSWKSSAIQILIIINHCFDRYTGQNLLVHVQHMNIIICTYWIFNILWTSRKKHIFKGRHLYLTLASYWSNKTAPYTNITASALTTPYITTHHPSLPPPPASASPPLLCENCGTCE